MISSSTYSSSSSNSCTSPPLAAAVAVASFSLISIIIISSLLFLLFLLLLCCCRRCRHYHHHHHRYRGVDATVLSLPSWLLLLRHHHHHRHHQHRCRRLCVPFFSDWYIYIYVPLFFLNHLIFNSRRRKNGYCVEELYYLCVEYYRIGRQSVETEHIDYFSLGPIIGCLVSFVE